jgi:hypothetical protein
MNERKKVRKKERKKERKKDLVISLEMNSVGSILVEIKQEFQFREVLLSRLQVSLQLLGEEMNNFQNCDFVLVMVDSKDQIEDAVSLIHYFEILIFKM